MAEGGRFPDSDDEADFEKIEHSDPEVSSSFQNVYVTHNKTCFGKLFNINNAGSVIFNQGGRKDNEPSVNFTDFISGKSVTLENDGTRATLTGKGFRDGVCFVNEIINDDKPVHFRITETFESSNGRCRLGFTRRNPLDLNSSAILNKGVNSVKTSDDFFITEPSMATCAYPGAVIYFTYSAGQVSFSSSKDARQIFEFKGLSGKDTRLWAFIELQGPVKEVYALNNEFHEVCGTNVTIAEKTASHTFSAAYLRTNGGFTCFSKEAIKPGQSVEYRLTDVSVCSSGNMRIGVSTENPVLIPPAHIPRSITEDCRFLTMELGLEDAKCGNIISLVPIGNQVCVTVNNVTQIGIINIDKEKSKWAVIELFGNTRSVELVQGFPANEPIAVKSSERHLERQRSAVVDELVQAIISLWMISQVLMNTFKEVADSIAYNLESCSPIPYWNSFLDSVSGIAAATGTAEYVQMVEWGDAPHKIRSEGSGLLHSVEQFQSRISSIKSKVDQIKEDDLNLTQKKQTRLLQTIAKKLPDFKLMKPKRNPEMPHLSPSVLNLSGLPTDFDRLDLWNRPVVRKTLLDTANNIEASVKPMEQSIRQLYSLGI